MPRVSLYTKAEACELTQAICNGKTLNSRLFREESINYALAACVKTCGKAWLGKLWNFDDPDQAIDFLDNNPVIERILDTYKFSALW